MCRPNVRPARCNCFVAMQDKIVSYRYLYMGKARHFKTFPQATYQQINFSLDLFLQLYFKI